MFTTTTDKHWAGFQHVQEVRPTRRGRNRILRGHMTNYQEAISDVTLLLASSLRRGII